MKILITGASGFLGQHVLAEAHAAGHEVVALTRRSPVPPVSERVAWVCGDLKTPGVLSQALAGCDAVIHLAGAMHGDEESMREDIITATSHLIDQVADAAVPRLVLVSSFAVYDYVAASEHGVIDEASAIESATQKRDSYCRFKLEQEQLARKRAGQHRIDLVVARPGVIYGAGRLWTGRMGVALPGRLFAIIGGHAALPLTYAAHCAKALLACAQVRDASGQTYNIVDDDPPTQQQFLSALRKAGGDAPKTITLPRSIASFFIRVLSPLGSHLPAVLQRPTFAARFQPMNYPNQRIKDELSWRPAFTLEEALTRSLRPDAGSENQADTSVTGSEQSA